MVNGTLCYCESFFKSRRQSEVAMLTPVYKLNLSEEFVSSSLNMQFLNSPAFGIVNCNFK